MAKSLSLTLLSLAALQGVALAGGSEPDGQSNAVPEWSEYCLYSITTVLSSYTFEGTSSSCSSSSSSSGSSTKDYVLSLFRRGSGTHGSSGSSGSSSSCTTSSAASAATSSGSSSHGSSSNSTSSGDSSSNSTSTATSSAAASSSTSGSSTHTHSKRSPKLRIRSPIYKRGQKSSSDGYCISTANVESILATAKLYCSSEEYTEGLKWWKSECSSSGYTLLDLTQFSNITVAYAKTLKTIDPVNNATSTTGTISTPVVLQKAYFDRAYNSYYDHDWAYAQDILFGWGIMGFWAGLLVIGMFCNAVKHIMQYRQVKSISADGETSRGAAKPSNAVSHWLNTHVMVPAALGSWFPYHSRHWLWNTIPNRFDSIIVAAWWIVAICLNCCGYLTFGGNIQTTSVPQQDWQYIADRTGILSYACLPMLWLFGARNNAFIWATGWNFTTFNIFHRHIARASVAMAIVHSIAYTVIEIVYNGRWASALEQNYFYMGIVATVVMSLMLLFSNKWLRHAYYETFLMIHIVFAIVTLYSLFRHTIYQPSKWNVYLWPPVAFWIADRTLRVLRVIYINLHVKFSSRDFIGLSTSTVTYNQAADVIRIDCQPGTLIQKPAPGQYYYMYQPMTLRGWENHPFTLGAYTAGSDATTTVAGAKSETQIHATEVSSDRQTLTFWVRPHDGWTRRLRDSCLKSASGIYQPRLLLEGPYGESIRTSTFDTVLMLVGGTGISAAVPILLEHARGNPTRTTKLHLVWTTKQKAFVSDLASRELRTLLERPDVEAEFFTTDRAAESDSEEDKKSDNDSLASRMHSGRADTKALIARAAEVAKADQSSVAVVCCGPAAMADEAREAVHVALKNGCRTMTYFEEAFSW